MGMFDTIHFERPITCAACQAEIPSTQTKAFECSLDDFRLGDCVGHAEEIRIVREDLYCHACRSYDRQCVYLAVYRGILVDIAPDLPTAEAQLRGFSFERLLLWYHDLHARRVAEHRERLEVERFLRDLAYWYEEGYDRMPPEEREKKRWPGFFLYRSLLEDAAGPLAAIRAYLEQHKAPEEAD